MDEGRKARAIPHLVDEGRASRGGQGAKAFSTGWKIIDPDDRTPVQVRPRLGSIEVLDQGGDRTLDMGEKSQELLGKGSRSENVHCVAIRTRRAGSGIRSRARSCPRRS